MNLLKDNLKTLYFKFLIPSLGSAMSYMKYINWFLPVAVFSNFIAIFVRADGNPNRAMIGVLSGVGWDNSFYWQKK